MLEHFSLYHFSWNFEQRFRISSDIATNSYIKSDAKIKFLSYSMIPFLSLTWMDRSQIPPPTQSKQVIPTSFLNWSTWWVLSTRPCWIPEWPFRSKSLFGFGHPLLADLVRRPALPFVVPSVNLLWLWSPYPLDEPKCGPATPIFVATVAEVASLVHRLLVSYRSCSAPSSSSVCPNGRAPGSNPRTPFPLSRP